MLWAAACLCFSGFLRSGSTFDPETHLGFTDVAVDNRVARTALRVTTRASKTDPFRQGVTLHITVAGSSLLQYMVARGHLARHFAGRMEHF